MQKYQTIENANAKSVQKGFKNHTQTNFNQGGGGISSTNYKVQ